MSYISYIQTEELLKTWTTIQGIQESLDKEIIIMKIRSEIDSPGEYIYTKSIGNKVITGLPPSGKISDTTGDTATSYQQVMKADYCNALDNLKEEKSYIDMIDDKLNIAFKRLTPIQKQILNLFYLEDKTWAETLEELRNGKYFITKHQAQSQRRCSVEKMQKIAKITIEMYVYVMRLVGGGGDDN